MTGRQRARRWPRRSRVAWCSARRCRAWRAATAWSSASSRRAASSRFHCTTLFSWRPQQQPEDAVPCRRRGFAGARAGTRRRRRQRRARSSTARPSRSALEVPEHRSGGERALAHRGCDACVRTRDDVARSEHAGARRLQARRRRRWRPLGRARADPDRDRCEARARSSRRGRRPPIAGAARRRAERAITASRRSPPSRDASSHPASSSMRGSWRTCSTMS